MAILGGLVVRNHNSALLELLAVVITGLANLGDRPRMLVEISKRCRNLEPDLRSVPELDPESALAIPCEEPPVAYIDLFHNRPGKVSLTALRQQGVLFLFFFDESLEKTISGMEITGFASLVKDVIECRAFDGTEEVSGLGSGAVASVFLEKLSGLEPLAVVLGLDDPAIGGRQELNR